jgi:1-acyl-sn-glycerol-3-phosphate acyltransferase
VLAEFPLLQRYFAEPYRFVPPCRGTFWFHVARWLIVPRLLRRMQVTRLEFRGVELLRQSLDRQAGILLASNHCRYPDPLVLGRMGWSLRRLFYYLVAYHQFKNNPWEAWWSNRMGGYSVLREGADRQAIRASVEILVRAERPIVVFPEGTWFRQNDRLFPVQEGVSLIARQAARAGDRPVVIHPTVIKYWTLKDPGPEVDRRLEKLERRLCWAPQAHLDPVERVEKLSSAFLAVKEVWHLGEPQRGALEDRMGRLIESLIARLEAPILGRVGEGWPLKRVRQLRIPLVRRLQEVGGNLDEERRTRQALDDLMVCECLMGHFPDYLRERPNPERLVEAVQRMEEIFTESGEIPVVPTGAVVEVGPPLDVRAFADSRKGAAGEDPLMRQVAASIQGLLDRQVAQGPPPAWRWAPPSGQVAGPGAVSADKARVLAD